MAARSTDGDGLDNRTSTGLMSIAIREFGLRDELMLNEMLDTFSPGWSDALAPSASGPLGFIADTNTFAFGAYRSVGGAAAEADSEPVGFAWGHHQRRIDGQVTTYLHSLDVVKAVRRQGIGSMLVSAVLDLGRRRGDRNVWLTTAGDNAAAHGLYELLGGVCKPAGDRTYSWYFS